MSFISLTNLTYPVGAIYQSTSSTSPASLFGGSWTQITSRFLWNTTSSGGTGGEQNHTLAETEMPSHSHEQQTRVDWTDTVGAGVTATYSASSNLRVDFATRSTKRAGGGGRITTCRPITPATVGEGPLKVVMRHE